MKKTNSTEIQHKTFPVSGRQAGFHVIFEQRGAVLRLLIASFIIWFSMLLIYGITSNVMNEFYRFIFFLRHPAVLALNGVTLLAAIMHTFFWFASAEKGNTAGATMYWKPYYGLMGIVLATAIAGCLFWIVSR